MGEVQSIFDTAAEFTKAVVISHYEREPQLFYDAMDENVMWIGPLEHQFMQGREQVIESLDEEQKVVMHLQDSSFRLIDKTERFCVVVGWIEVCTEETSEYVVKFRHRLTFIYKAEQERLIITHMHVSESCNVLKEGEKFPFHMAMQTYKHMKRLIASRMEHVKLLVYDTQKKAHVVMEDEILYIEACNVHCCLYCVSGKILVTHNIGTIMKRLSDRFIRVHRSYIVNVDYVTCVKRFQVQLSEKIQIPVPEKKYIWVRKEIEKRIAGI